ncbi:hypothetical protein V8C86DRAFT_2465787 [Haematococcus lacustris]
MGVLLSNGRVTGVWQWLGWSLMHSVAVANVMWMVEVLRGLGSRHLRGLSYKSHAAHAHTSAHSQGNPFESDYGTLVLVSCYCFIQHQYLVRVRAGW